MDVSMWVKIIMITKLEQGIMQKLQHFKDFMFILYFTFYTCKQKSNRKIHQISDISDMQIYLNNLDC